MSQMIGEDVDRGSRLSKGSLLQTTLARKKRGRESLLQQTESVEHVRERIIRSDFSDLFSSSIPLCLPDTDVKQYQTLLHRTVLDF